MKNKLFIKFVFANILFFIFILSGFLFFTKIVLAETSASCSNIRFSCNSVVDGPTGCNFSDPISNNNYSCSCPDPSTVATCTVGGSLGGTCDDWQGGHFDCRSNAYSSCDCIPIGSATGSCGDGVCSAGEDYMSCPDDCSAPSSNTTFLVIATPPIEIIDPGTFYSYTFSVYPSAVNQTIRVTEAGGPAGGMFSCSRGSLGFPDYINPAPTSAPVFDIGPSYTSIWPAVCTYYGTSPLNSAGNLYSIAFTATGNVPSEAKTATVALSINTPTVNCKDLLVPASGGSCKNITQNSYTMSWTPPTGPTDGKTRVRVGPDLTEVNSGCVQTLNSSGTACVASTTVNSVVSSYNVNGLQPNTTYYNRVPAVCTQPDGSIQWVDYIWSCSTPASSANSSSCTSITAPASVNAGQNFSATVVMKNTGTKTWQSDSINPAQPHRLGSQNPQDNSRWGTNRITLPVNNVAPGQNATFTINATAPSSSGSYAFDWKMVQDAVEWFGETCAKTIIVNSSLPTVTIAFNANPTSGPSGFDTNLTWTVTNADTCTASGGGSTNWSASPTKNNVGGSQLISNITSDTSFTLTCSNSTNTSTQTVNTQVLQPYRLTVTRTQGGSVNSTDGFITCGTVCSKVYIQGSLVTLVPLPSSPTWEFAGWSGDCNGLGDPSDHHCNVLINSAKNVNATFIPRPFIYKEF